MYFLYFLYCQNEATETSAQIIKYRTWEIRPNKVSNKEIWTMISVKSRRFEYIAQ